MPIDEKTGLDDQLWTVQLRDDQMDCVIESLSWLIAQHGKRIETEIRGAFDHFAHQQAKARLEETLAVFADIGHRQ